MKKITKKPWNRLRKKSKTHSIEVFLDADADILISASVPASLRAGFIKVLARKRAISSSIYCIKEADNNLSKIKSSFRVEFDALVEMLVISPEVVLPNLNIAVAEKDLPVLVAALAGGCTHLLTGDLKHFGFLMGKKFNGIEVLSTTMIRETRSSICFRLVETCPILCASVRAPGNFDSMKYGVAQDIPSTLF